MMSRVKKAGALAVLALTAASCVNSSFFFNPPRGGLDTTDGQAPAIDAGSGPRAPGAGGATGACSPVRPVPPEVQPRLPRSSVADICSAAFAAPPSIWGPPDPTTITGSLANADERAAIVGRWVACSPPGAITADHPAIEFGANGRWQLLAADPSVGLAPDGSKTGYYYALGENGQLNLDGEGPLDGSASFFLSFAEGMDALRVSDGSAAVSPPQIYARTQPSGNGDANTPQTTDGRCKLEGTWEVPANPVMPVTPAALLTFDAAGNFVGAPLASDNCPGPTMYGTYRLSPGWFQLTSNVGMGLCAFWFTAAYPATFDQDCATLMLVQMFDGCTGGRGYLNGQTTLVRRN